MELFFVKSQFQLYVFYSYRSFFFDNNNANHVRSTADRNPTISCVNHMKTLRIIIRAYNKAHERSYYEDSRADVHRKNVPNNNSSRGYYQLRPGRRLFRERFNLFVGRLLSTCGPSHRRTVSRSKRRT